MTYGSVYGNIETTVLKALEKMMKEKPTVHLVPEEDIDMYGVDTGGWYLFNNNHKAVDGPFASAEAAREAADVDQE